jgi:hypothetical protein
MLRTLFCSLVVLVGVASTAAQPSIGPPTAATGVVVPASDVGGSVCVANASHAMACNGGLFFLTSSSLDLDAFLGQNVKLTMSLVSPGCPLYEVTAVDTTPPATLTLCGTAGGLGCPFRLRSGPGALSEHWVLASAGPGFVPLGVNKGAFLLELPFLIVGHAVAGGVEGPAFDFVMPDDPSLIGLHVFAQSARRDVGPVGPIQFGNAVCWEILGYTLLCHDLDC